jgi:uncharacterized protein (TIGR04255 family)
MPHPSVPFPSVFPFAPVKRVLFRIDFPQLFSMENLIGEFQTKIMAQFPDSKILMEKAVILGKIIESEGGIPTSYPESEPFKKIWQFKSEDGGITVQIALDNLTIDSASHKTYNNEGAKKFRETIEFVVKHFLDITHIPIIKRIGLRYIDECPIPIDMEETSFSRYYHSSLPIQKFSLKESSELTCIAVCKRGEVTLRFQEHFEPSEIADQPPKLILDFDGSQNRVIAERYLAITDAIHEVIGIEFRDAVTPVFETYMQTGAFEG